MKKILCLMVVAISLLMLNGCNNANSCDVNSAPTLDSIKVGNQSVTIEEINDGIKTAFNQRLYYNKAWGNGQFLNKILTYELFFTPNIQAAAQPQIYMVITNVTHHLSTVQEPLLYTFGINITEHGLQSEFCLEGHVPETEGHTNWLKEGASYLGSHSIIIDEIVEPKHEVMSDQWKLRAEAAILLYMDGNNFYAEKSKNLQPGKYSVYIQGFSESDVDSIIVFEHEDGRVYMGKYYFVHSITAGQPADLNHVALVENIDTDFMAYLSKIRLNAALIIEATVQ